MAQQSVRRGRKNQGFPPCFTSTLRVMWFRSANSHTGSQHSSTAASEAGQMAASDQRARHSRNYLRRRGRPQMESGQLGADHRFPRETSCRVTISVAVDVWSTPSDLRVSSLVTFVRRHALPAASASNVTETAPEMDSFARARRAESSATGSRMISPTTTSASARDRRTRSGSTSMRAVYVSPLGLAPERVKVRG